MDQANELVRSDNESKWKVKTLLAGAILGAAIGLGAAYLLTKRA